MNIVQKLFCLTAITAESFILCGCDPENYLQWSPDGRHALVTGGDGDYLIDASGKILGSSGGATVWMPDSQHAAGVRTANARNWEEYAGLLGPDRAGDITRAAEELLPLLQAYHGEWNVFEQSPPTKRWATAHPDLLKEAAYYLHEKQPEAFDPIFKAWQEANGSSAELAAPIYELVTRSVLSIDAPDEHVLLRSADQIFDWLRPSPDGKMLAFASADANAMSLQVIPAAGGNPSLVEKGAALAEWTSDGQQLVYARATSGTNGKMDEPTLGSISRRRIRDHSGALLDSFGTTEDLAGIVFLPGRSSVACLPDGRILFASLAMQLPAVDRDMPKTATLFTLQPDRSPVIKRLVSEKAQKQLPGRADCFVLSPDCAKVAIPGEKGELSLITIATGEITKIQGPLADYEEPKKLQNSAENAMLPSWRNAREISYVVGRGAPGGSPGRAEVVLRKLGGEARVISKTWPDAMTNQFLPRLKQ